MISRWASEPPRRQVCVSSAASWSAAARAAAGGHAAQRPGERSDDLAVGRVVVAGGPGLEVAERGGVVLRQVQDGGVHGQERRRRVLAGWRRGRVGDVAHGGYVVRVGRQRPAEEQRPGVDERPAAERAVGAQLRVVAAAYGVEVAERQLVQRRVPGEVAEAVGAGAVAADPVVHPGEAGVVVAGLVVRVRPGVRGVPAPTAPRPASGRRGPWPRRSGAAPGA